MSHAALPLDGGLEIRVLGPLEAWVDGAPLVVDTRKALAILALLAVEGRPFARDELAAMLWPESDDESARGALRRTISVLRSALGDRWLRIDRATVALERHGALRVDLDAVLGALERPDAASLRAAAAAARGPFLAGFSLRDSAEFDDWRATRAVAVERAVAEVLDRLAASAEAAGDLKEATAAAARRVDLDPLDEAAHRRLMRLLARAGDRAGAIRQYRACVAVLERELGVAPLAETTELYDAIRDASAGRLGQPPWTGTAPGANPADSWPAPADGQTVGSASPAAVAPQLLPMVGRDRERATLLDAAAAIDADGRVAAVTGEAGIGKSRLVDAIVDVLARAGGRTVRARAYASERGIAYGPIVELLRTGLARPGAPERMGRLPAATLGELERLVALPAGLVPERSAGPVARPADGPAARARLLQAVAAALAALVEGRGGLVVVEDLQWADDATHEALLYLARRLAGRPLVLALTWRPEDLDELGGAFASAVESLPDAVTVPLGRLDRAAVERLVAAAGDEGRALDVEALLESSEGLPLYLVEAMSAGTGGGDASARSVRALLHERLASVGETAGQIMAAAAVLGRSFDLSTVRGTSGRSEDETISALEELVRRGIVREQEGGPEATFDFAHAKLRDAAYEQMSLARRRLLHRRAAELLRGDAGRRGDPGRLVQVAGHELAAGRDAAAAQAFRDAGLAARGLYANREAARHLETALALGHPDVAGIQLVLGETRMALGDYAGAVGALEAAAAASAEASLAAVEVRLGQVHARRGDLATAASHLDAAIEMLESTGGPPLEAGLLTQALVERAVVALRAADAPLAAGVAARALSVAEVSGDAAGAGAAHRMLGLIALERGELDDAHASLIRSVDLAGDRPDAGAAIAARNALALVEAARGDRASAIALLESALDACRRTGERHLEAAVENNLADQLHAVGRGEEAMEHLKRAVALFAEVGSGPGELEPEIWKLVAW